MRCEPRSERGLVVVAGVAAARSGGRPGLRSRTPRVVGAGRAVAAARRTATLTADPVDLGRGVPQRGADLVDLQLHDGALLALPGLERTLPQPAADNHPHTPGQRLGNVLRSLSPDVALQEQRFAVLPLPGLPVEGARRGGNPEV